MDGNNDLIIALKSAVHDSRLEFNADTSTKSNKDLCAKAIRLKIVDWTTCDKLKLASYYRDMRLEHEEKEARKSLPLPKPVLAAKKTPEKKAATVKKEETPAVTKAEKVEPKTDEPVTTVEDKSDTKVDDKLDTKVEEVKIESIEEKEKEKEKDHNNTKQSKDTLLQAIHFLQDKFARNDFDITLENSMSILDFVQNLLK
jgi:hypothetical protein